MDKVKFFLKEQIFARIFFPLMFIALALASIVHPAKSVKFFYIMFQGIFDE